MASSALRVWALMSEELALPMTANVLFVVMENSGIRALLTRMYMLNFGPFGPFTLVGVADPALGDCQKLGG